MWKPSEAGVCSGSSAIECFRPETLKPEVPVDSEATDQNPEYFHEQSGEVEVEEQGSDYQAGANRVQQRVGESIATELVQLQHQIGENEPHHTDIAQEIHGAVVHSDSPNLKRSPS